MQNETENTERFGQFLQAEYHGAIEDLADQYPDEYALHIDWEVLAEFDLSVAKELLANPDLLDDLREALRDYHHRGVDVMRTTMHDDLAVEPALYNLPDEVTFGVGEYRHTEVSRIITVTGQVTKRTEVNPMIKEACKRCATCGERYFLSVSMDGNMRPLSFCRACDQRSQFYLDKENSKWTDHQLVRVQTPPEEATDGNENIHVHLTGPLTGIVEGGDRIRIPGVLHAESTDDFPVFDKYFVGCGLHVEDASFEDVEVSGADIEEIEALADRPDLFEVLRESVAPAHKGDVHLKDAIVLQLFSDFSRDGPDGSHHRGKSHILLFGDPGSGKTLLLNGAAHASPRSAYTDGMNSSAAGLTACMTRDDFGGGDGWSIEAGTIVKAHRGMAVIDELDKADEDDLDALHTALESEIVPVSKAGKSAILPAETALLAAGNPTGGHFDPSKPFEQQIELKSPLLSRFDLIFAVREKQDEQTVREIAQHMARARDAAGYFDLDDLDLSEDQRQLIEPEIPHDTFKRYIAYATRNYHPLAENEDVLDYLAEQYVGIKTSLPDRYQNELDSDSQSSLPVTARTQLGIQRLAAARARARLSDTFGIEDVDVATDLVRRSLRDIGVLDGPTSGATARTDDSLSIEDVGIGGGD